MEAPTSFTRSEASTNRQFRIVEVHGHVIGVGGAVVIDDRESLPDRSRLKLLVADLRRHLRNLTLGGTTKKDRPLFGSDRGPRPVNPREHIDIVNARATARECVLGLAKQAVRSEALTPGNDLTAQSYFPRSWKNSTHELTRAK